IGVTTPEGRRTENASAYHGKISRPRRRATRRATLTPHRTSVTHPDRRALGIPPDSTITFLMTEGLPRRFTSSAAEFARRNRWAGYASSPTILTGGAPVRVSPGERAVAHRRAAHQARLPGPPVHVHLTAVPVHPRRASHRLRRMLRADG